MNLSYFRNSKFSFNETLENLLDNLANNKSFEISVVKISESIKLVNILNKEWLQKIILEDHNIFSFVPDSIVVVKTNGKVLIGTSEPSLLTGLTQNGDIIGIAEDSERILKEIIDSSAGVTELKPTRIKLYSTKTCPYCVMEKDWFEKNKIEYETIFLEDNTEAAQKIVKETSQMGVPVTEFIFEEGTSEFVIGFDKHRLSKILKIRS